MNWNMMIPLALMGFSANAMAADVTIDGTAILIEQAMASEEMGPTAQQRSSTRGSSSSRSSTTRSNGRATQTRSTGSRGRGGVTQGGGGSTYAKGQQQQRARTTTTRGNQTRTTTAGRSFSGDRTQARPGQAAPPRGGPPSSSRSPTPRPPVPGTRSGNGGSRPAPTARPTTPTRSATGVVRSGTSARPAAPARPGTPPRAGGGVKPRPVSGARPAPAGRPIVTHAAPRAPVHTTHHGGHGTRVAVHGSGGHRAPVHHGGHGRVRIHHARPYHGVFVYGPRPVVHNHYQNGGSTKTVVVKEKDLPTRAIDRTNSFAIGVKGGSLYSGYQGATGYADVGMGLTGRYRPAESVGLELSLSHFDQTWTNQSERSQTVGSASVELFAYPWTRVSPYAIGGLTMNNRSIADEIYQYDGVNKIETGQSLVGAHAGLGIEFALGKTFALDLEGRYIGYLNKLPTDASRAGAWTTSAGLVAHF